MIHATVRLLNDLTGPELVRKHFQLVHMTSDARFSDFSTTVDNNH